MIPAVLIGTSALAILSDGDGEGVEDVIRRALITHDGDFLKRELLGQGFSQHEIVSFLRDYVLASTSLEELKTRLEFCPPAIPGRMRGKFLHFEIQDRNAFTLLLRQKTNELYSDSTVPAIPTFGGKKPSFMSPPGLLATRITSSGLHERITSDGGLDQIYYEIEQLDDMFPGENLLATNVAVSWDEENLLIRSSSYTDSGVPKIFEIIPRSWLREVARSK